MTPRPRIDESDFKVECKRRVRNPNGDHDVLRVLSGNDHWSLGNGTRVGPILENSMLDGLSQDLCGMSHCAGQKSSPGTCKGDTIGIIFGKTESCRGDEKGVRPSPGVDCSIAINTMTDSSDQNSKSETSLNDLVRDG